MKFSIPEPTQITSSVTDTITTHSKDNSDQDNAVLEKGNIRMKLNNKHTLSQSL